MELPPPPLEAFAAYLRRRLVEEGRPPLALLERAPDGGVRGAVGPGTEIALFVDATAAARGAVPEPPAAAERAGLTTRFSGPGYLVLDRLDPLAVGPPPETFRVLAIVTTFNEADIVGGLIERLRADGIAVHVIDNWSTDGTAEIIAAAARTGACTSERFPAEGPSPYFELRALLRRVEVVAHESGADWVIHHDADEVREGPWPGVGLRQALWAADRYGATCADHTVVNFLPVDDDFRPGADLVAHFRHFEFGDVASHFLEQKAWKPQPSLVRIAETGGHEADFAARRVFPYKFLLRHYPIRSQAHGERKIFRERQGRFHPGERAEGWHIHYDEHAPGESFLRDPAGLLDAADLDGGLLLQRLSGAGLHGNPRAEEGPGERSDVGTGRVLGASADAPVATLRIQLALAPLPPGALGRFFGALGRSVAGARDTPGAIDVAITDRSTAPALAPHRLDALAETLGRAGVRALCYEHRGKLVGLSQAHRQLLALGPAAERVLLLDGSCLPGPDLVRALLAASAPDIGVVFARRLPLESALAEEPPGRFPADGRVLGTGTCALVAPAVLAAAGDTDELDLVTAAGTLGLGVRTADAAYVADAPLLVGAR